MKINVESENKTLGEVPTGAYIVENEDGIRGVALRKGRNETQAEFMMAYFIDGTFQNQSNCRELRVIKEVEEVK